MGKEATGFNISKENYTWSKERDRRGTDSGGGQTTCTAQTFTERTSKANPSGGPGSSPLTFWKNKQTKSPNDRANTNQSLYLEKHTCASTLVSPPFPDSLHQQGVGGQPLGNGGSQEGVHRTGFTGRGSQDVRVLHQLLLVIPRAPDGAEGALLVPPSHPDQADHGGSQQEDQDHHEQPHQDYHCG